MKRISLQLSRLSISAKIAKTRSYVNGMTGNANFPTPNPTLAATTTAVDELETAMLNADEGGVEETTIMYQKEAAHDLIVTQLGNYVENTAAGDPAIIQSANMEVAKSAEPIGPLPQVGNLRFSDLYMEGKFALRWDRVRGAKVYVLERSTDGINWEPTGGVTKTRCEQEDVTAGTRYYFRVAAMGTAGLGDFSQPVSRVAA